jgi:hypothetical protein
MLELIITTCLILCILVAILTYKSYGHVAVKLITLPLVIVFSLVTITYFMSIRGTPITDYPKEHFTYIHHEVELVNNEQEIVLWIKDDDNKNKMFTFQYDRDTMKKLNEMKEEKEKGNGQPAEFIPGTNGSNAEKILVDYDGEQSNAFNIIKK